MSEIDPISRLLLLSQFQNDRKLKIVRAHLLVEIFPNIKQQFEIDVIGKIYLL